MLISKPFETSSAVRCAAQNSNDNNSKNTSSYKGMMEKNMETTSILRFGRFALLRLWPASLRCTARWSEWLRQKEPATFCKAEHADGLGTRMLFLKEKFISMATDCSILSALVTLLFPRGRVGPYCPEGILTPWREKPDQVARKEILSATRLS